MLAAGQLVPIEVEKPAAGGRMIGRVDGQVVLVTGAIPGERVTARIERIQKHVVYATIASVERASPDRREPPTDLLCGGSQYAHIDYPRQLTIKSEVIADGFRRLARIPLPAAPVVAPSSEDGYRMRARLHVRNGKVGFFREGTHELCEPRSTRQLRADTCDVLAELAGRLARIDGLDVQEIELTENLDASERVAFVAAAPDAARHLSTVEPIVGLTGLVAGSTADATAAQGTVVAGAPYVRDRLTFGASLVSMRRHVLSFFQGNRYLIQALVQHVVEAIDPGNAVVDLYAGVGLLSIPAAVVSRAAVIAVEGDRVSSADLHENARQVEGRVEVVHTSVEAFTARRRPTPDVVIVDPPRTGMSKEALDGAIRLAARRLVYVSCDVATLARDSRRLVDAGYAIEQMAAFDLFPNTPHVETVVRFQKA